MTERTETGSEWWRNRMNLASLWEWLDNQDAAPGDGAAYFMRKPWKWDPEWERFQAYQARIGAPAVSP